MKKLLFKLRMATRKQFPPSKVTLHGKTLVIDRRKFSSNVVNKLIRERYELSEIRIVRKALSSDDRVLEMGAGMGLVSMVVADVVGDDNILCYEADPQMVQIAKTNFSRNKHNIEINHGVISTGDIPPDSIIKFYIHSDFWSSSTHREQGALHGIDVPSTSLDTLLESFRPTVLLMDIEGDEVELLMGATDFGSVRKIIMEIHYKYVGQKATNSMIRTLYSKGFDIDLRLSCSGQVVLTSE